MPPYDIERDALSEDSFDKAASIPIEVLILTNDHEIKGIVYVSRHVPEDRRITTLLNEAERRFLAITDAELLERNHPSSPRHYTFLQLHIDKIIMIHPAVQTLIPSRQVNSETKAQRLELFRQKLSSRAF
jgi:hypothetical protein